MKGRDRQREKERVRVFYVSLPNYSVTNKNILYFTRKYEIRQILSPKPLISLFLSLSLSLCSNIYLIRELGYFIISLFPKIRSEPRLLKYKVGMWFVRVKWIRWFFSDIKKLLINKSSRLLIIKSNYSLFEEKNICEISSLLLTISSNSTSCTKLV